MRTDYLNEYHKERVETLTKELSSKPKPSQEEALEQYKRLMKYSLSRLPRTLSNGITVGPPSGEGRAADQ